jgi:mRNA interferase RelE/StbE
MEKLRRSMRTQEFERLRAEIAGLATNPRPKGMRRLKGREGIYRTRMGSYRVMYKVFDAERLVAIVEIARRNEGTYRA